MSVEREFLKKVVWSTADLQTAAEKQMDADIVLDPINRKLFEIVQWYSQRYSSTPSIATLKLILAKSKISEETKQKVTLLYSELAGATFVDRPLTFLIDELKQDYKTYKLRETLTASVNNLEADKIKEAIDSLKEGIVKLELTGRDDVREGFIDKTADERFGRYTDIKTNPDKYKGIHIGWPTFDSVTNGVRGGQLMVLIAAVKEGKCLKGDTLIFTDKGIIPLEQIAKEVNAPVDTFVKHELKLATKDGVRTTSHFYNAGLTPTIKLKSRFGFEVEGTNSHPLLIIDKNAQLTYKNLEDIQKGEYICIQRGQEVWGKSPDLTRFTPPALRTNALDHRVPKKVTKELARLLGYLVSEGYTLSPSMTFSNTDSFVVEDFNRCSQRCFGVTWKKSGEHSYVLHSKKIWEFLQFCGLTASLSNDKEIPRCILEAPREIVIEFLKAYYEGDGCVDSSTTVSSCSISEKLSKQLHIVLSNLGIIGKLRSDYRYAANTAAKRHILSWTVLLRGKNLLKFAQEIGFLSPKKRSQLHHILSLRKGKKIKSNVDIVPFLREALRKRGVNLSHRSPATQITYEYLSQIMSKIPENIQPSVNEIIKHQFFFDEIVSLGKGYCETYDFTVPDVHNFISNGIVSHNSTALLNIAHNVYMNGFNVLYVSVEMPKEQVERRFDARATGLSYSKIRDGRLNPMEEQIYKQCLTNQKAKTNKFYTIDSHNCSTSYLRSKIKTFPHKFDLVVLDYLTLVQPAVKGKDQWESIGKVTEEVRAIAREMNIPIITAAQANRDGIKEAKYKYNIENIGLSHLISAHADTLLSLRLVDRDELEVSDVVEMTAATIAIRDDRGCRFTIDANFDKMLMAERTITPVGAAFIPTYVPS